VIAAEDIGGIHIKYLHHCRRQLWLYGRGFRPELHSDLVQLGEAIHETSYPRTIPVDLGAARLDFIDGENWVHEVKSSSGPTKADEAQVIHYCHRLRQAGVDARGGILHYPKTRRTHRVTFTADQETKALQDIDATLAVLACDQSPPRISRVSCRGCSYLEYCWAAG
jgi:CRISPR-associated exonuclease Cas4